MGAGINQNVPLIKGCDWWRPLSWQIAETHTTEARLRPVLNAVNTSILHARGHINSDFLIRSQILLASLSKPCARIHSVPICFTALFLMFINCETIII